MITASEFYKWLEVFQVLRGGVPPPSGALLAVNNLSDVNNLNTSVNNLYNNASFKTIYVSSSAGVDAVNRGNQLNPFHTLSYALSQITPSSSSPYLILMQGIFNETNLALKPWCSIFGNDAASLTVSGSVTLDSSWSSGGEFTLNHFFNIAFPSNVTLDFDAVSSPSTTFNFSNNLLSGATTLTITGNSTNGAVILLENNVNFANSWNFDITNCYGAIDGGDTGNITINHSSETAGGNFNLFQLTIEGNLSLNDTTTSAGMSLFIQQCKNIGTTTYASNGSAFVQVFSQGNLYFSTPTMDNGTSGGEVQLNADFLNSLPTLLNGAVYVPTTISDAIIANNYFTPSNYALTNGGGSDPWNIDSITSNFAGIDAALGSISSSNNIPQIVYADSVTGDDGTADGSPAFPYATYAAASSAKAASATQTNQYVIDLNGTFNESGGMNVYPFVSITSRTNATFNTSNTVTLDNSWNTIANGFCRMGRFVLNATQVSLQFTVYQNASLEFDIDWGTTPDIQIRGSKTTAGEIITFYGTQNYNGNPQEYEFYDITAYLENVASQGDIIINNNNSFYPSFTTIKNSQAIGTIFNSTSNTQNSYLSVFGSPQITTIELQDNKSNLTIDSTSYTSQVLLAGTSTISNLNIISLSDGVNCSTYSPINFSPITNPGVYGATALTAYIAGIDSKLNGISQQLFVNATSGNDSNSGKTFASALATYDVGAYPIVLANASPSNPYVVYIIGNSSVTSNFNVLPYCTVIVVNGFLTIPGQMIMDSSFTSAAASTPKVIGMINAVGGINLDYSTSDGQTVILNIDPTTTPSLNVSASNTTTSNAFVFNAIPNGAIYSGMFLSGITLQDLNVLMQNAITYSTITMTGTGTSNASLAMQNSEVNSQIVADGTSGPLFVQLQNTFTQQFNLVGTNPILDVYDDQSYPSSLILSSGALISQIGIFGSTDGLQFSTTFIPVNFSAVPGNWPTNSTTAMFAGIDNALAASITGTLQDAYNDGSSGSKGHIDLTTDNLNPIVTTNSVRGSGSTLQRHFDAFNTVPITGGLGFWGFSYSGYNSSISKVDYAYTAAFASTTTAGSETATWTLNMMQGGTPTTTLHVNAAAKTIDTPYAIQNPGGTQAFNTKLSLTSSLTYAGDLLGFNNISDDLSAYTITINTGGFSLNLDDCFYIQTQGTNTVTLAPSGGATINGSTSNFVVPVYTKATVQLVDNSTKEWVVTYESSVNDISSGAFPFSYDAGNSSGISGTPVIVFGSYTVNGDFVTANITVSLNASSTSVNLAFTAPFVSSFPIGNFSSATGSVFTDTIPGFGAVGLMGVIASTTSLLIPLAVTSIVTPFYVSLSFSYQFQNF